MFRACAVGVAVRQPQQCYRAGTSLLHYKASSVSLFPPENRPSQTQVPSGYIQGQLSPLTDSYSPSRLLLGGNPCVQCYYRGGCSRRVSYFLCRACFEVLPFVGRPFCGRCGAPTAFEVFGCDECRDKGFAFDGTQAPLRYEGMGEEPVHAPERGSLSRRDEGDGAVDVRHARGRPVRRGGAGAATPHVAR